jgi:hypothetical protein
LTDEEEGGAPVAQREVIARKGADSMVKIRWTGVGPAGLDDVDDALELGAKWEGEELVVYDLDGFKELYEYYEDNDYLIDND